MKQGVDQSLDFAWGAERGLLVATWNRILEQVEQGGHVRSVPAEAEFGSPLLDDAWVWEVDGKFRGLDLPAEVLRKIFKDNAEKWYPGI